MFISGFLLNREQSKAARLFSLLFVMTDPQTMPFPHVHDMA